MRLFDNPFHLLGASPRDDRSAIRRLADEAARQRDDDSCSRAESQLADLRSRLDAELGWLPGLAPERAQEIVRALQMEPETVGAEILSSLDPLCRANVVSTMLAAMTSAGSAEALRERIERLAEDSQRIDPESVRRILDQERSRADIPAISDTEIVEEGLELRRRFYSQAAAEAVGRLQEAQRVELMTGLIEDATDGGSSQAPVLLLDLVDRYEVDFQHHLTVDSEALTNAARELVAVAAEDASADRLDRMTQDVIERLREWDRVARPVQVAHQSQGFEHALSRTIALAIREVAVELTNEHDRLDLSRQLNDAIREAFAEVRTIADQVQTDSEALNSLALKVEVLARRAAEHAEQITYSVDIGDLRKDRFSISPDGIEWKGVRLPLEDVTRVRWGGTRQSENGTPAGIEYEVFFGSDDELYQIDLRSSEIFQQITHRLFLALGIQIMTRMLEVLRDGRTVRFGDVLVRDASIVLPRRRFMRRAEMVECGWGEISIWTSDGALCIGRKDDEKTVARLSFKDQDNAHILEIAIRTLFTCPATRMSEMLRG